MSDFVRIQLHDNGEGIEDVWARAVDAGLYEIASVPFLHMSPTAGDVIAVVRDDGGNLTYEKVVKRGGRWVAVYNWYPRAGALTTAEVVAHLEAVARDGDLIVESCLEPMDGIAGCVYIAAPPAVTPEQLDSLVRSAGAPADLERILPVAGSPQKPARLARAAARKPAKPAAKKPAKPAAKKKKKPAAKKPAKPAAKKKKKPAAKKKPKPAAKKPAKKRAKPAAKKRAKPAAKKKKR